MPIAPVVVMVDILIFVGLAGHSVSGVITSFCHDHPNVFCTGHFKRSTIDMDKRDIIDLSDVPKLHIEGRADVGPCNVPKYNFDLCHDQVKAQKIQVASSIPSPGVARFDNVPPACMNLASVLGGSCTGADPRPTPCGSACMQYTGLSDEQMAHLSLALNAKR